MEDPLRRPALKTEIEAAITLAVQRSDPACAKFVGAIIAECKPKNPAAGWTLKGVRYGAAPREKCDVALEKIVATMQAQYVILTPSRDPLTGYGSLKAR